MKQLLGAVLLVVATQAHPDSIECDLDGNASALQASEFQPARKSAR